MDIDYVMSARKQYSSNEKLRYLAVYVTKNKDVYLYKQENQKYISWYMNIPTD